MVYFQTATLIAISDDSVKIIVIDANNSSHHSLMYGKTLTGRHNVSYFTFSPTYFKTDRKRGRYKKFSQPLHTATKIFGFKGLVS